MPSPLAPGTLIDLGIDPARWETVERLTRSLVASGQVPAVSVQVVRHGFCLAQPLQEGMQTLEPAVPLREDARFLVASLTKPIVAMAALLPVERGEVSLQDPVRTLIPEFDSPPNRNITIRHLLTHTSGLPDMLPNNRPLRQSQSPLTKFLEGTCGISLDFPPGHGVQYQSMGFLLLGEIIRRVTGQSCQEFVKQQIVRPLGMYHTALGAPDAWFEDDGAEAPRIAEIRVPQEQQEGDDWNWNSRYWRQLGAPWGGLISTVGDLALFCKMMLDGGRCGEAHLFSPATVATATTNQLLCFPNVPEADRRTRPWGFGWRLNWPAHSACFGDLLGSRSYGHWGATGTLFWIDPDRNAACVILSTQPLERNRSHLTRLSNATIGSFQR